MKRTPGPWFVQYKTGVYFRPEPSAILPDGTTVLVASTRISPADAQLIAASPELLEAAQALLHHLEQDSYYGCFDGFGKRDQANTRDFFNSKMIKPLVAAIAKATGETNESGE